MQRQREQLQLMRLQTVPRDEVLAVELLLQIRFHQERWRESSVLSAFMVIHLGPSWLQDGIILLMRFSLRGSHSSRHRQQSRLRRVRRDSRQRRQSRHLIHSFAALVVPELQSRRG